MQVNQVRAGAILSYVSMAVSTILSLVYAPIMKGQLGTSEYGVYGSVGPIIAYLLLLSMGLGSAYMRYYSQAKVAQDRRTMAKLNGMFLVTYTVLGLVLLVLGFTLAAHPQNVFGAKWTEEELALGAKLLRIMSVNAALSFPISVFESNVNINERYLFLKLVAMAKSVLSPMISIPLLLLGYHSPAIAILSLMLTIVSGVVEAFYCLIRLRMPISFRGYDFALMKSMMGFTFYVFIAVVVDQVNYGIGTLMTTWIHGTELSAVYYNANQLNVYYLSFAMAISNVLAPRVHRMVASNTPTRELGRLMTRAGRLQFIMLMCVFLGFVAVGRPFVDFAVSLHHHVLHPVRGAGDPAGQGDAQVPGLGLSGGGRRQRGADDPPVPEVGSAGRCRQHPYRHIAGKRPAHQLVLLQKDRAGCETVLAAHRPAAAFHAIAGHCGGADRPLRSGGQLSADRSVGLRVRGRLCRKSVDLRHEPLRAGTGQQYAGQDLPPWQEMILTT